MVPCFALLRVLVAPRLRHEHLEPPIVVRVAIVGDRRSFSYLLLLLLFPLLLLLLLLLPPLLLLLLLPLLLLLSTTATVSAATAWAATAVAYNICRVPLLLWIHTVGVHYTADCFRYRFQLIRWRWTEGGGGCGVLVQGGGERRHHQPCRKGWERTADICSQHARTHNTLRSLPIGPHRPEPPRQPIKAIKAEYMSQYSANWHLAIPVDIIL